VSSDPLHSSPRRLLGCFVSSSDSFRRWLHFTLLTVFLSPNPSTGNLRLRPLRDITVYEDLDAVFNSFLTSPGVPTDACGDGKLLTYRSVDLAPITTISGMPMTHLFHVYIVSFLRRSIDTRVRSTRRLEAELDDSQDASAGIKGDDRWGPTACNRAFGSMMIF